MLLSTPAILVSISSCSDGSITVIVLVKNTANFIADCGFVISDFEIRNPHSEIRIPKSAFRNTVLPSH
jgi:hypothetical protein